MTWYDTVTGKEKGKTMRGSGILLPEHQASCDDIVESLFLAGEGNNDEPYKEDKNR
jgi:hypothetical protein